MKSNLNKIGLLIVPFAFYSINAGAIELDAAIPSLNKAKEAAQKAGSQCPTAPVSEQASCNQCTQHLKDTVSTLEQKVKQALANYNQSTASGMADASKAGATAVSTDKQNGFFSGGNGAKSAGSGAKAGQATASKAATAAFKECAQQASGSTCSSSTFAQQDAQNVMDACQEGEKVAGAVKQDNEMKGGTMEDMAGLLGQAAQALGPLMQAMQKPPGAESSPSSPSSISSTKPTPVAGSKLTGDPTRAAGGAVGFSGGTSTSIKPGNPSSGYAAPYAAREFAPEPSLAEALGGNDPSNLASAGAGGFSASGGSSSGSGGFGSSNSSGASTMGEKPNAIVDPGAFEMPVGGGGSSGKPFLGLKSKSSDLGDLAGDSGGSGVLGEGGFDEGGRDLASSDGMNSDIHSEEGGTLFEAIRMKYSEIKKRGNI